LKQSGIDDTIFFMEARNVDENLRAAWNQFVACSQASPILQSYEWGELKSCSGWQPIRIAVFDGGEIIAGASILKRKIPYLSRSIFYAPRGPILDFKDGKVFDKLLEAIVLEAEKYKAILIKIDPFVLEENKEVIQMLKSRGFIRKRKQIQPRATLHIDLTKNLEDIIASFEEKTRYNVKLSKRKGVNITEASNDEGMEIFYKMYRETGTRDRFLIHPASYYRHIKKLIIDKGFGNIFLAHYEGSPIAGVLIFTFGEKVWYMYGASKREHRNVMPNHALHWHVIKWAKEKGFKIYDLWGIPVKPSEDHPLWGVYRFKKGFNGRLTKLIGVYDKPLNSIYYHVFDKGLALWQGLRSLVTKGKISDSLGE